MTSRRERYERANIRGGLGVRHKLGEDSLRDTYRLNGVQTGSAVVRAHDKYRGDFTKGFDVGVLVRKTASTAVIHWVGDDEPKSYHAGDARYEVDRGRWRFLGIVQGNPMDPDNPIAVTLTALRGEYRVASSPAAADDPTPPTEETPDMAEQSRAAKEREAAKKQIDEGSLQDRETYTAKQVATRCGTDSKTMRKFFRSANSTVDPVGQGGRYEFAATDLPQIKREFDAWQGKAKAKQTKPLTDVHTKAEIDEVKAQARAEDEAQPEHNSARRKREQAAVQRRTAKAKTPEGFGGIDRYGPDDPDVLPSFGPPDDDEPTPEALAELEGEELDLDDLDEDE